MKIKILEHNNSGTPKFKYFGIRSILEIDIKDKIKFIILPVNVGGVNIPWDPNYIPSIPDDLLIFHDGSPGVSIGNYNYVAGRVAYQPHVDRGSQYMFWLSMSDPDYATGQGGWTSGTPFDYFSEKTVLGWKKALESQGATPSTKGYCYINWTEDSRQFLQFNGYTGPPGVDHGIYRTLENYDAMQKAWAKHFIGGVDTETGNTVNGLRFYFPGISFGIYNVPQWWYNGDSMWSKPLTTVENDIDTVAQILVDRAPDLWDAIQLLMPSVYSYVNNPVLQKCQSAQATTLCRKINEKLVQKGKTPLQIVPYITPFYWTEHTGTPYTSNTVYSASADSYCAKKYGIYTVPLKYLPPFTRMTDTDLTFECTEPLIQEGANGAIIWLGQAYRLKQIAGRTLNCELPALPCNEDVPISYPIMNTDGTPKLDESGNFQWKNSWRRGVTGAPAVWSDKDLWRQAVSADLNYQAGVCMGITGNRWWWKELKGSTQYTPTEWLPLQGRERFGYPNQPMGQTGMSLPATVQRIDEYLTGTVTSTIENWKKNWLRIKYGKK